MLGEGWGVCMGGNCRSQCLEFAAWELAPRKGVCGVVVLRSGGVCVRLGCL